MKSLTVVVAVAVVASGPAYAADPAPSKMKDMVYIEGGDFQMGDIFDEKVALARPVHKVTLSSFYLNRYEVTVEEFTAFVKDSGYATSAEHGDKRALPPEDPARSNGEGERRARLASPGAWVLEKGNDSWGADADWRNPHFEQTGRDPVTAVSWWDAVNYCNWLSKKDGLPVAYDLQTGNLLDELGNATTDVVRVRGYRLPTEAEWEYAARERGRKVRFGNGQDIARSGEMNFDASNGEDAYSEKGTYRGKTVPVGTFKPNKLGLHDMSGNVWEWCSDLLGKYSSEAQLNPYQMTGVQGPRRAARGGPWVGGADWARVSARLGWLAEDRCNNIGLRIAKSK